MFFVTLWISFLISNLKQFMLEKTQGKIAITLIIWILLSLVLHLSLQYF